MFIKKLIKKLFPDVVVEKKEIIKQELIRYGVTEGHAERIANVIIKKVS